MGEAAKRKNTDKIYGDVPKEGMGLVISNPILVDGGQVRFTSGLDAQELRYSLLFWDRLVWPDNNLLSSGTDPEAEFLINSKILTRPKIIFQGRVSGADLVMKVQLDSFLEREAAEPGRWTLAQGEKTFLVRNRAFSSNGGTLFNLIGAIPVPDKDVPLEEILEFKRKRRDELLTLRIAIDGFVNEIHQSGDSVDAVRAATSKVEMSCLDAIKVTSESRLPFRLLDTKLSYSLDFAKFFGAGFAAEALSSISNLQGVTAHLAAMGGAALAAASIKLEGGIKFERENKRHPFRYVSSFHRELFNSN